MEKDKGSKGSWILETNHLSRVVSGKHVVEDISIQVERGDVMAIVGPSGSGKSSFLRLLNRLDEPTSGTVYLEGMDCHEIPPRQLRRQIGMMTQTAFLFPGTIADNLRFGPHQQGKELAEEAISRLLNQVGLAGQERSDVSHLSGGEAQRVSLARALANTPLVLLLDEPTSALDEATKQEVESLILQVVRQNSLTCLMVTHDPSQAARMAVHALLLREGKLDRIGPAKEVLNAETSLH